MQINKWWKLSESAFWFSYCLGLDAFLSVELQVNVKNNQFLWLHNAVYKKNLKKSETVCRIASETVSVELVLGCYCFGLCSWKYCMLVINTFPMFIDIKAFFFNAFGYAEHICCLKYFKQ